MILEGSLRSHALPPRAPLARDHQTTTARWGRRTTRLRHVCCCWRVGRGPQQGVTGRKPTPMTLHPPPLTSI
ncbi:hypothetical protein AAHE18_02G097600 [Arachis hypogaea]